MADVWINEFHYRNSGTDTGEFVEVAGLAGIDLTGWRIVLYSGNGGALLYDDDLLSGTIPDQGSGFGAVSLAYPVNGLENDLEGIALVRPDGSVAEFISYGGSFIAADGPAAGMTSVDVGVAEGSGTAAGASIGRVGAGGRAADFGWAPGGDDTPGAVNIGQTFQLAPDVYEPDGNEAPVNSTTPDAQVQAAVTWLADGLHYVIVWVSDEGANGFDVRARTFNADGTATGLDFLVATGPDSQVGAQVAALSGGGFVVVWGDSTIGTAGIWGRIYDSTLAGGAPILLKAGLPVIVYGPSVSGFASGDGFVVTWTEDDGTDTNVMAQVFTAAGIPSGPEVTANAEAAGAQFEPAVAALAGGDYVVVWQDSNETDAPGIRMAIYGQDGTPVGGADVLVNTTTASTQELPAVAALAGGGYVVAWVDWSGTGADTSSSAIRAQIFTSGGAAVGLELLVNSTTFGAQSEARIATLPDGGFVVSWTDGSSGDDDIRAQRFDADGNAVDAEFLVNSDPGGNQAESAVAASPVDGDLVLAWTDYGPVGTPTPGDIERRAFDLHANPTVDLNGTEAGFDFASAYSEGGAGATIADADLAITQDAEHPIQTITIVITDAVAGDQLTLAGALPAGITSNAPGGTTLTLTTAGASAGDLQLALLQVRYSTTSDNPALGAGNGDRTISIVANDGSLSSLPATATVAVAATNDPATISGTATGDVTEDGTLVASGTLTVTDPDAGENALQPVTAAGDNGYGGFVVEANGQWTYTLTNAHASVQALPAGATLSDTITVSSADGTDTQEIIVTITGANDGATIDGTDTGDVSEDGTLVASGTLTVTDSDTGQNTLVPVTAAGDNGYGGFVVQANGQWTYTLTNAHASVQALPDGGTLSDTITVSSADGTDTREIIVTITGANDGAAIDGTDTGSVTEDGQLTASGTLSVDDPDSGEDTFLAETGLAGIYGTLDIDAAGAWTYTLSNAASAVQALNGGGQPTDTIIVQSIDGTPHNIVVTVNGANDAPVADDDTAAATEDDAEVTGSVATNDSDTDDGETATLEYSLDAAVAGLTFDPDGGYSFDPGDAAYQYLSAGATTDVVASYTVTDVNGATDTATLTITVTGVDDEPALAATALNPIFVEGGTAVDLFNAVTASTVEDGQTFTSMTLTVTNVTEGASEILSLDGTDIALIDGTTPTATNSLSVTVSVAGSIATLSFSGATLSAAQLQILVDTLSYRNTSQAPADANRVVTITELVDSGSNASPNDNMAAPGVSSSVDVVPVNDAPTSTLLQNDTRTWTEGNGFVTLDVLGNATLSDFDSPDFDTGSLSVSINSALPEDDLGIINTAIVTTAGNVVSVNSVAIGTFSGGSAGAPLLFAFNSEATPARIAQLVRAIGYSNSGGDIPTAGLRTVTWTFNDGDGTANGGVPTLVRTSRVNVVAVNDSPEGADVTVSFNEDTVYYFSTNDFAFDDIENQAPAGVRVESSPTHGTLFFDPDGNGSLAAFEASPGLTIGWSSIEAGNFYYVPAANGNGTGLDSFTFSVVDSGGAADAVPNLFTFDVAQVNDAPVNTVPGPIAIDEEETIAVTGIQVADTEAGPAGAPLSVTLHVDHGTLHVDTGVSGGVGANGVGGNDSGTVTLTGTQAQINATLADAGGLSYTPTAHHNGTDTLSVATSDLGHSGTGGTLVDTDTIAISIAPVSDSPTGVDHRLAVNEDVPHVFTAADFTYTDFDDDDLLSVTIVALPLTGTILYDADGPGGPVAISAGAIFTAADLAAGRLTYAPLANAHGTGYASFTYRVRDTGGTDNGGQDIDASPNTITIDVEAVNDAPTVSISDSIAATEQITIDLKGVIAIGDIDSGSGVITVDLIVDYGILDAVVVPGDAIVAGVGTTGIRITGTLAQVQALLGNDPNSASSITYTAHSNAPPATATLTVTVYDNGHSGAGGTETAIASETIQLIEINDAPSGTSHDITINEDSANPLTAPDFDFSDVDGDSFTGVVLTTLPTAGTLVFDPDGAGGLPGVLAFAGQFVTAAELAAFGLIYFPAFNGNGPNHASFTFQVRDGGGTANGGQDTDQSPNTMNFNVEPINDAPVLDPNGTAPGVSSNIDYTENDPVTPIAPAATVSDVDNPDYDEGRVRVIITNGISGEDVLSIINQGTGTGQIGYANGIVTYEGNPIGHLLPPAIPGDTITLEVDLEGAAVPVAAVQALLRAIGYISLSDDPPWESRNIEIYVQDPGAPSPLTTWGYAAIHITAVDDPAVARDDAFTTNEATPITTGNLFADNRSGPDSDLDDLLTVAAVAGGTVGSQFALASGALLTVNADGTFAYDPNGVFDTAPTPGSGASNQPLPDSFTYTLVGGNSGTVTITIIGLDTDDVLIGTAGADALDGGVGNDFLTSGADGDHLQGGDGDDTLLSGEGDDHLDGGAGRDGLAGGAGIDFLLGGADGDYLFGEDGGDTLLGEAGDDYLEGGAGRDGLAGGAGIDFLLGGADGDYLFGEDGGDTMLGEAGDDHLDGGAGSDGILGGEGSDFIAGGTDRDFLFGEGGADTIVGDDGDDVLDGGDGDDGLAGGTGADRLNGGNGRDYGIGGIGDDFIVGGADDDVLLGEDGSDTLIGEAGEDRIEGGAGVDGVLGGDANDYIDGGADGDFLSGEDGVDTILGGEGDDHIEAGAGQDGVLGGAGADFILGGADGDYLFGEDGADSLIGEDGDDHLDGGSGADVLIGGAGGDTLIGGSGADLFAFTAALGAGNVDAITDFSVADDTIALDDAVFAGLNLGALSANAFVIGAAAQDGDDRIIYNSATGQLFFDADGSRSGAAVLFATLQPGAALTANDFTVI